MADRIKLLHITFVGSTVEPASVEFGPTATVICGPSDTGKSFIVGAIDFMLGGSNEPNDIPERVGYSTALLGLQLPTGESLTLSRSVNGGDFGVFEGDIREDTGFPPARTLKARHQTGTDESLSSFLLSTIGLANKRIRKNNSNQTNVLTFRNLVHLCIIDETSMQAERQPALTEVNTSRTSDISTLKLLLEEEDDSSLVAVQSPSERKQTASARESVLDRLISDSRDLLEGVADPTDLQEQLARIAQSIANHTESIGRVSAERSALSARIANTERDLAESRERLADIGALTSRFELLGLQYNSDLERLEMISEAGNLLGYFNPGQCVFCGAEVQHQHYNEDCAEDTTAFRESVLSEQSKTMALNADLNATLIDLGTEQSALSRRLSSMSDALHRAREQLRQYDEALTPEQGALKELLDIRSNLEKHLGNYEQIVKFEKLKQDLIDEQARETATAAVGMQLSTVSSFSREIAARLQAWDVPNADDTRYDKNNQDVVSGDQFRSAHGKGVRAILHAAFTLGLARYCFDLNLPHPGFVILDSPLVTYRPPEKGGDADGVIPPGVIEKFYADISDSADCQIIVLENTEPPEGLGSSCVKVTFTKNELYGRYGFFPVTRHEARLA